MMTLHLNLLSPAKKNNFMKMARYLFVKEMLEFTLFTVALLAMMYIFAWWIIAQAMSDAVSSALLVNREAPPVNKDIQELNKETKDIITSGKDFLVLSTKLSELSAVLPADIKLSGINISRVQNSISISGVAATRDALLDFQRIIGEVSWIEGVTAPTSQLFQKENINFEIHGNIKGWPQLRKN